jgi:hypothetical protein
MIFREATIEDIPQIQIVRNSVKENRLSHPSVVTDDDCKIYLTQKGKGWVCETENNIVAFAIADLKDKISGLCLCILHLKTKALEQHCTMSC